MLSFFIPIRYIGKSLSLSTVIGLLLTTLIFSDVALQASQKKKSKKSKTDEILSLEKGQPVDRELSGGQSHSYQIKLSADRYLQLIVEQRGIDVAVTVFAPDGKQLLEIDSPNGTQGIEPVELIAQSSGNHRIEIKSLEKAAPAGRYEIKVVDLRKPTAKDRALVEAAKMTSSYLALRNQGDYQAAKQVAEQALGLREKAFGTDSLEVAQVLNDLGLLYVEAGDYAKAEAVLQRDLSIKEKKFGAEDAKVAMSLNTLGLLYSEKGDYAKAEAMLKKSLAMMEKKAGKEALDLAPVLNNLARTYQQTGDYVKAEPLFERALSLRKKILGDAHPDVARSLGNLAEVYFLKGDYGKAEPLLVNALKIVEHALGKEHPDVATYMSNLAALYYHKDDYGKAAALLEKALVIKEKYAGANNPDLAIMINNLASLYSKKGDTANVEKMYKRALEIKEKTGGPNHPDVAFALNNLGLFYSERKDYARAESFYLRGLDIYERAFGPGHPDVAATLNDLATVYLKKGDYAKAIGFQIRGNTARELDFARNLASGSERQKFLYLKKQAGETNTTISLHANHAPASREALRAALTVLLQRKGRALDAMADTIAALRRYASPADTRLLDELIEARGKLSTATLTNVGNEGIEKYKATLKRLEENVDKLEASISARNAEFRVTSQSASIESVQQAIPKDAALIEFARYQPVGVKETPATITLPSGKGKKPSPPSKTATAPIQIKNRNEAEALGNPRYIAYLLKPQGEAVWVDLGDAKIIDEAVDGFRQSLRNRTQDVMKRARAVEALVLQPVRKLLGETRRLFISPDGALNLIPFAALVDERNTYLVKQYAITYLTTGRDLLRLQLKSAPGQMAMIFAAPDFGGENLSSAKRGLTITKSAIQAASFSDVFFPPLPGTEQEALALKKLLPDSVLMINAEATETALKQVNSPKILHIATHGFFLEDAMVRGSDSQRSIKVSPNPQNQPTESNTSSSTTEMRIENPLLRSGLGMAGANLHRGGEDDGVLTALEVAGLNLWGTQLVVLSACDTGVGEIRNGEGVFGLRRALVLAGSESQLISLWPVSDLATRDLMIDYYKALKAGQGRGDGLRQVQLKMLANNKFNHPYFWASFIQSGAWASLNNKRE
jgi:CHAT domain-containing protein/Tfp pilus assembly protein PilF